MYQEVDDLFAVCGSDLLREPRGCVLDGPPGRGRRGRGVGRPGGLDFGIGLVCLF